MWAKVLYKILKMSDDTKELIKEVFCTIWTEHKMMLFTVVAIMIAYRLYRNNQKKERRTRWDSAGKDVVVLHGFERGLTMPALSPFVLKLETYLRMLDIKYEFDSEVPKGPKGKTPWVTINGEDIADSQIIMERLGLKFNKDFSKHLTPEQKGANKALTIMAEEHLFWGLEWWYFVKDTDARVLKMVNMPSYYKYLIIVARRHINKALRMQGLGRHTDAEIEGFMRKDLKAASQYLGSKKFFGGDEPCEADCSMFGMLAQFIWAMPGSPFQIYIKNELPNLIDYCDRVKEKFWKDWDKCVVK